MLFAFFLRTFFLPDLPVDMRKSIAVLLAAVALAGGATAGYLYFSAPDTVQAPTGVRLPDLEGRTRSLDDWAGQVRVVNFWAPWCPPCRREVPELIALQAQYADQGLVVLGITVDTAANARDFAVTSGINYPLLIADDIGIALARSFGNTVDGLPFTAVLDRDGRITHTHAGEISRAEAEASVKALLVNRVTENAQ
jgi:thiol-disulfide isomerase/thioredoxin